MADSGRVGAFLVSTAFYLAAILVVHSAHIFLPPARPETGVARASRDTALFCDSFLRRSAVE